MLLPPVRGERSEQTREARSTPEGGLPLQRHPHGTLLAVIFPRVSALVSSQVPHLVKPSHCNSRFISGDEDLQQEEERGDLHDETDVPAVRHAGLPVRNVP